MDNGTKKKKWYRSRGVKGALLVMEHLTLVVAALCSVFLLLLYGQGIRLFDGKSYGETKGFADELHSTSYHLLEGLQEKLKPGEPEDYDTGEFLEKLEEHDEGNTNLTYLYVDKNARRVYTNKRAYESYRSYEENLKEMSGDQFYYVILQPMLVNCSGNLNFGHYTLQQWQHMAEQAKLSEDYVFALAVDKAFPIGDSLALKNEVYEKNAPLALPILAVAVGSFLLFAAGFIWITAVAGRRPEDEEVHLCAFDRIFTEIAAILVLVIWLIGVNIAEITMFFSVQWFRYRIEVTVMVVFTAVLFFTGWLSLVRRIKARTLWKNSLLRWLLKNAKSILRKIRSVLDLYSRNTKGKLQTTALVMLFLLFQFLILGVIFSGGEMFLLLLFVIDAAVLVYCMDMADGNDRIVEGLKRISEGELTYKINLKRLSGRQKLMAEYINRIGDGLDAAVENSLKNERMKAELITNVSHDIKTPLTSIINYVDLLKRENFTDPKICGYLDILEEKSQRLKKLTEDVVEASKASTGNISLEMAELNLTEMIYQVIGEFEEKFEEKHLSMMVHLGEEPVLIQADGRRLWRVLENIFNNVVKYAMEGTRVYAETKVGKKTVAFSLKNISAQPLNISADELTERFIRGDVARNTEGSGLGLSIAKSLTELQGGTFELYLDGDLFRVTVTFPVK